MSVSIDIKRISAEDVILVRHPVLRTGRPRESAIFDGDLHLSTIHLGAFTKQSLVGVLSAMAVDESQEKSNHARQIRGMAVLDTHKGQGIGRALITALIEQTQNECELLWCNARVGAAPFYLKNGFVQSGELFEIPMVGPHYRMRKTLSDGVSSVDNPVRTR